MAYAVAAAETNENIHSIHRHYNSWFITQNFLPQPPSASDPQSDFKSPSKHPGQQDWPLHLTWLLIISSYSCDRLFLHSFSS